jgi:uncharacterized membrane-anchored protein
MRGWLSTPLTFALLVLVSSTASATNLADFNPTTGPTTVDLGRDLASLNVGADYYFIDAPNTKKLMQALGNPPSGAELGTIIPKNDADWFVVLEYEDTGYIKDDQGASLDAAALLESIRKGTERSNAQRTLMGHPAMHLVGWVEKPHYDTLNKRLVWALSGRADGADHEVVNFNTRVLGRHGLISVVLVTDKASFERDRAVVPALIGGISFKPGKRYEEFVKGTDKVAEYGLAALVAGGAGVAVVKAAQMGLFARFWKVFVLGGIAALGGLWKWITGRGNTEKPATA